MTIFALVMMKTSMLLCPHQTTVKDWITALSIWLETANADVDDFYQYIDEDTRVVFQKGPMLNRLPLESRS